MNANIAPIIYAAAFIVFMTLGLYHAHKMRKPTLFLFGKAYTLKRIEAEIRKGGDAE